MCQSRGFLSLPQENTPTVKTSMGRKRTRRSDTQTEEPLNIAKIEKLWWLNETCKNAAASQNKILRKEVNVGGGIASKARSLHLLPNAARINEASFGHALRSHCGHLKETLGADWVKSFGCFHGRISPH